VSDLRITTEHVRTFKDGAEPELVSKQYGWVRSPIADRMTAWHLRNLVRTLDAQAAPDNAKVIANKGETGHTTHLIVEWVETLDPE
jgi:hypothetical protein